MRHLYQYRNFIIVLFILLHKSLFPQLDQENFKKYLDKTKEFASANRDSASFYGGKALAIANSLNNNSYKVDVYLTLAISDILFGNIGGSSEKTELANQLINEYNLTDKQADVLMYRGVVNRSMGLTSEALKYLFQAKDELEKNRTGDYYGKQADLYYYIANTYLDLGELQLCQDNLNHSIELSTKSYNPSMAFKSYMMLIGTYSNLDTIQQLYSLVSNIVENEEKSGKMQYEKVVLLNNLALFYESMGQIAKAKSYYLNAIKLSEEKGFLKMLIASYNNLAYILMDQGEIDSSLFVLNKAASLSQETKQLKDEGFIYDSYGDLYLQINDYKKALEYKNLAIKTEEEYRKNQRIQESFFLSAVFETKKKEEEILASDNKLNQFRSILFGSLALIAVLLTVIIYFSQKSALTVAKLESVEKGKSLEVANALLEGTDNERKRLAMDLHDGLGAQLGSLKFMVDTYIENNPNYQKITNSIDDICQNVRGLSHRMLPTQLEKLGLVPTIQNLAHSVSQSSGFKVEVELEVEERLEPKLEINLYYLIFELINNAIKHSKGDSLFIQLLAHEDGLNLSVEDNGEGFNVNESKDGLGLQNIKHRVEYLGGKLIIDSKIGQGTLFMIEVPT